MREEPDPETLEAFLRAHGVGLSPEQAAMCLTHIRLMLEWNPRINLTRITDFGEIMVKHLLDSLLPGLRLPHSGDALDIGTGAGFPGVPLKVLHPGLNVSLLESSRKKISFLRVLLSGLPLRNIRAVHGRWEDFTAPGAGDEGRYALITMRALRLETAHLCVLAPRILAPGGLFAWWAGPGADPQWEKSFLQLNFFGKFPYDLPGLSDSRHLYIWKKEE